MLENLTSIQEIWFFWWLKIATWQRRELRKVTWRTTAPIYIVERKCLHVAFCEIVAKRQAPRHCQFRPVLIKLSGTQIISNFRGTIKMLLMRWSTLKLKKEWDQFKEQRLMRLLNRFLTFLGYQFIRHCYVLYLLIGSFTEPLTEEFWSPLWCCRLSTAPSVKHKLSSLRLQSITNSDESFHEMLWNGAEITRWSLLDGSYPAITFSTFLYGDMIFHFILSHLIIR